jgi:hypothetical protein
MKTETINVTDTIGALKHIESGEYVCLLDDGIDYLCCFSDGDTALEFRASLKLQEHVDLHTTSMQKSPFTHFWFDGEYVVVGRG